MDLATTATTAAGTGLVDTARMQIESYLIAGNFFIVAAAIAALPMLLERAAPSKKLANNEWVVRFTPLAQVALSFLAVRLPGAITLPDQRVGTIVVAAVWTAALVFLMQKMLGHVLLGDDPRIETFAVESPGQYTPATPTTPESGGNG